MHAVVRTDRMYATDNRSGLVSVRFKPNGVVAEIDNGNVVRLGSLENHDTREVFVGETPSASDKLSDIALIASTEVMYSKKDRDLSDFYNKAGNLSRGYRLHFNDIFSATESAFCSVPAVGDIVELTSGTKLNPVKTATGATIVGRIIDTNIAGGYLYYVVKVVGEDGNNEATVESLRELANALGGDASECTTVTEVLNVISTTLGGSGDAQTNAEAIEDIAQVAPAAMEQNVEWVDGLSGEFAFDDADGNNLIKNMIKAIVIPEGCASVGAGAFKDCTAITAVVLPNSVTSVGDNSFTNDTSLVSIVMSDNITYIGAAAFAGCSSLESIVIPDGVSEVQTAMFSGCESLKSIVIPYGVKKIHTDAFAGCNSLTSIILPGSIEYISSTSFRNCSDITDIYVLWSEGEVADAPWGATNATIHYNWRE